MKKIVGSEHLWATATIAFQLLARQEGGMHDRVGRVDEIAKILAGSQIASVRAFTEDERMLDACLLETLLENRSRLAVLKDKCPDKSIESRAYNELLMAMAEVTASIRGLEMKYDRQLTKI